VENDLDEAAAIRVSWAPALQGNLGFGQKKSVHFVMRGPIAVHPRNRLNPVDSTLASAKMGCLFQLCKFLGKKCCNDEFYTI
jgi:hypothetical protein